ncbi:MAG TPA: YMGG-like glycine zipper-containing protein [Thermoanaerobaculia bacterium]
MRRHSIASLLICTTLFTGCVTTSPTHKPASAQSKAKPANIKEWVLQQNRAQKQAMIGALVGAALGAATGGGDNVWKRAAAGAVVGAMAGFVIGRHQDKLFAERDLAVRQEQYDSSQGYIAKVEAVSFNPPQIKPGQTATIYVRYLVLGPNPNEPIKVHLFRGLKYGEDYVVGAGPNDFTIPRGGGIVDSTMQITLPAKAPEGTYSVEALVDDEKERFTQAVGTASISIVAAAMQRKESGVAAR